jgi:hypothetical protein
MKKFALVVATAAVTVVAGCSSNGGGSGVSVGHGSPKAAVEGFLTGLQSSVSNDAWCSYVDPAGQQECRQAFAQGATFRVHGSFALGNQVSDGNEALVAVTGNACLDVDAGATTSTDCAANTSQNDGLPSGAQTFAQAYSNALNSSTFATAACIEVNGEWYLNKPAFHGSSSSSTTTPSTSSTGTSPTTTSSGTVPSTTPATEAVNYGQQFLADAAPWDAAVANARDDGLTSPQTRAAGQAAMTMAQRLLAQAWPTDDEADVHTLAEDLDLIDVDIQADDLPKFDNDATNVAAATDVVKTDLGLATTAG